VVRSRNGDASTDRVGRNRHCPKCQNLAQARWTSRASPGGSIPTTSTSSSHRLSAYEQWALPCEAAWRNELQRGLDVIASGETVAGAARFAHGAGRHGDFDGI
jgi:enoyl-CoA hydratase